MMKKKFQIEHILVKKRREKLKKNQNKRNEKHNLKFFSM